VATPTFTGMGLATSLGHDAVTAAAAARAGLVRPAPLTVLVDDADTKDAVPVVGHPVDGLAAGFDGVGRLLRLAELGLRDLLRSTPVDRLRAAHWLIALPEGVPTAPPLPLLDPDAPPDPDGPDSEVPGPSAPRLAPEPLRHFVEATSGLSVPASRFATFDGRVGFIRALGHAQRLCERGTTCVVGAVDSLVDTEVVRTLHAHGRLLSGGAGVGLEPGEGAAFFVVEPDGARPSLGSPGPGALGNEPDHLYSGVPVLGRGLAAAVPRLAEPVWPISDCNGESYRSTEWGHAVVRDEALRASVERTLYPATSVGDAGAAAPALGLAFALRAFARRYARRSTALLLASDALGARGTIAVHAP
jgi:3-oxoacyl-[acyl-carrier-protein] synthase-1